ncbi:phosphoribosylanthranilate isomerase [Desulfurivibrio alkaliphilus]|uniref:N-(5'-phosphoribosyl)anthranilate isomerase n=1 Tax=Desulfurivibrio alkaliphilus (strain DSM 19089 / UNIQEM U267 / AHT2) TaxID=589865 RepID=D6Z000_DESAT|nr:phosphoribosylanthranilate isomerase [Desulfurivibrio alkaliphilus]ADH85157.1 Phosphoribosylanthranilate isomerase [Desulfurivibrio alkaliphilus AHT 2]
MEGRTRIKVCGMTEPVRAREAVAAGVDALGFIFAPQSPRLVLPEQAREIIATLPPFVDAVGVFVNEEVEVVREIAQYCGLTMLQLHGDEEPEFCRAMPLRVIKAIRVGEHSLPADLSPYRGCVSAFLLDTYQQGVAGGTGQSFDWQLVARLAPPAPVVLAGGLTPDNVGEAIARVRPFAVDFNSGLETAPGLKDSRLLRRAVAAVGLADGQ